MSTDPITPPTNTTPDVWHLLLSVLLSMILGWVTHSNVAPVPAVVVKPVVTPDANPAPVNPDPVDPNKLEPSPDSSTIVAPPCPPGDPVLVIVIQCNHGPQPPPTVIPTPVDPPKPTPPHHDTAPIVPPKSVGKLFISIVEDPKHRSVGTAQVLAAMASWEGLKDAGHTWRIYDGTDAGTSEEKGVTAVRCLKARGITLPGIVILNQEGSVLVAAPLPQKPSDVTLLLLKTLRGEQ